MRYLQLSIAAAALIATGAMANPGNGNDKGNGKDERGGAAAKMERSGGPDRAKDRGGPAPDRKADRASEKPRGTPAMRSEAKGNGNAVGKGNGNGNGRDAPKAQPRGPDRDLRVFGNDDRRGNDRDRRDIDIRFIDRGDNFDAFRDFDRRTGLYEGCPPGLAKKYNGCMPPGLAKKQPYYRPAYFGFGGFGDTRFYYDDGFLLRLGRDGRISASIPLLGGALAIGNPWPTYYQPVELRPYYRDFYGLRPNGYRYAGNAIYRVDPETAAITSVAALLTGDDFVIGQPVPAGYPVYNVPYRYRDRYVDGPDGYYRYSDGYVYRVDPETRLVAAAIELLVD